MRTRKSSHILVRMYIDIVYIMIRVMCTILYYNVPTKCHAGQFDFEKRVSAKKNKNLKTPQFISDDYLYASDRCIYVFLLFQHIFGVFYMYAYNIRVTIITFHRSI